MKIKKYDDTVYSIMNILEPIFQQYLYQEMTEPNEDKRTSGGTADEVMVDKLTVDKLTVDKLTVDKLTAGSTAGLPISRIITSESTRGGNPDMTQRISKLAVPYGLVLINELPGKLPSGNVIPSGNVNRISGVIPDELFTKLVNMVEQPEARRHTKPRTKRLSKSKSNKHTKRVQITSKHMK